MALQLICIGKYIMNIKICTLMRLKWSKVVKLYYALFPDTYFNIGVPI